MSLADSHCCCRQLVVMVSSCLSGTLVQGVERLRVGVIEVFHSSRRARARGLMVLVVMGGREGRWKVRGLKVRLVVRHGVPAARAGVCGCGVSVVVMMVMVVRGREGRRASPSS